MSRSIVAMFCTVACVYYDYPGSLRPNQLQGTRAAKILGTRSLQIADATATLLLAKNKERTPT